MSQCLPDVFSEIFPDSLDLISTAKLVSGIGVAVGGALLLGFVVAGIAGVRSLGRLDRERRGMYRRRGGLG